MELGASKDTTVRLFLCLFVESVFSNLCYFLQPNSVLERDELRKMFNNERGWTIIHDEMCLDGDKGEP